jgi:hypothetical protein
MAAVLDFDSVCSSNEEQESWISSVLDDNYFSSSVEDFDSESEYAPFVATSPSGDVFISLYDSGSSLEVDEGFSPSTPTPYPSSPMIAPVEAEPSYSPSSPSRIPSSFDYVPSSEVEECYFPSSPCLAPISPSSYSPCDVPTSPAKRNERTPPSSPFMKDYSSKRQRRSYEEESEEPLPVHCNFVLLDEEPAYTTVTSVRFANQEQLDCLDELIEACEEKEESQAWLVSLLDPTQDFSEWKTMSQEEWATKFISKKSFFQIVEWIGEERLKKNFIDQGALYYMSEQDLSEFNKSKPRFSAIRFCSRF